MKSNGNKYYPYPKDSSKYTKYWTTNEKIIQEIKKAKKIDLFAKICFSLSLIALICVFVFVNYYWVISLICSLIFFFGFLTTIIIAIRAANLYNKGLFDYEETDEFKNLQEQYLLEEKVRQEEYYYNKAKDLVNAYNQLNNNEITEEQKITFIQEFLERRDKNNY